MFGRFGGEFGGKLNYLSVDRTSDERLIRRENRARVRGRTALATYRVIHGFGLWERVEKLLGEEQASELLLSCEVEWLNLDEHLRIVEHALATSDRKALVEVGEAIGSQCLGEACRYGVLRRASKLVGPMAQVMVAQAPLLWTGAFLGGGSLMIERVGMRQAILAVDGAPRSLGTSDIWQTVLEGAIVWSMAVVGARARVRIFSEPRANSIVIEVRWDGLPNSHPFITAM